VRRHPDRRDRRREAPSASTKDQKSLTHKIRDTSAKRECPRTNPKFFLRASVSPPCLRVI
jgi:hypothetical protein